MPRYRCQLCAPDRARWATTLRSVDVPAHGLPLRVNVRVCEEHAGPEGPPARLIDLVHAMVVSGVSLAGRARPSEIADRLALPVRTVRSLLNALRRRHRVGRASPDPDALHFPR